MPSESTFSRAFDEFAKSRLPEHVHQAVIPLAEISHERVTNLYDMMDSAYDACSRSYQGDGAIKLSILSDNLILKWLSPP